MCIATARPRAKPKRRGGAIGTKFSCSIPWADCAECDAIFVRHGGRSVCPMCWQAKDEGCWYMGRCRRCGEPWLARDKRTGYCTPRCYSAAKADRYQARKRAQYVEDVWRHKVYERDNWTCQLCNEPVEREAVVPEPWAPSLDHIIPFALGGQHSYANVQLAHFWCNSIKGDSAERAALLVA